MPQYRIKSFGVSGRDNKVFETGDIAQEEDLILDRFDADRPQKLLEEGHIELAEDKDAGKGKKSFVQRLLQD